ncbi:ATP-binding cassette transporter [Penicillium angulare]|uniref:ATP-binding cassette transporter n=1 Tax=Penicillium angulare TaxID=116970 RepID=A0A9W9G877_9EURO|nr:ATP-binding cassette transporter [Penicillium angulare]
MAISKTGLLAVDCHIPELIMTQAFGAHANTEENSSIIGNLLFLWIRPMLHQGYSATLLIQDLPEIHSSLLSDDLRKKAVQAWKDRVKHQNKWGLPFVLFQFLKSDFLFPIIPRIFLIIFRYAQPVFIGLAIEFVKNTSTGPELSLVLYAAIIYLGMAVSAALYQNRINRLQVMIRGALIGLLHHYCLNIPTSGSEDSEVLTLMGTDVDSLISIGEIIHEIWAQMLEVVIGTVMLSARMQWLAILPLIAILACSRMSAYVAAHLQSKQKDWNFATQKRIATTTTALTGIKSLKMMGIEDAIHSQISHLRKEELLMSKRLRWIHVAYNASANALGIFAPVLTLILYSMALRDPATLQASGIFTSVALLGMVTHPANMVMTLIPRAIAVMANFSRIESYLARPLVQDPRELLLCDSISQFAVLDHTSIKPPSLESPILSDVHFHLEKGDFVICAGAVGSGKTTLALALLWEIHLTTGSILVSSQEMGYCAQNPWLPNTSIRSAIPGRSDRPDMAWYNTVIEACGLAYDLNTLDDGDMTMVENNGINLSGGQKHRIALARAVFSRHKMLILDDPFSALDHNVADHIFKSLFGSNGLFKRTSTTVFLISNSGKLFPRADKLVILSDGKMKHQNPDHFKQLGDPSTPSNFSQPPSSKNLVSIEKEPGRIDNAYRMKDAANDLSRRVGDLVVYRHYLAAVGQLNTFLILFFTAAYSFLLTFSNYVLKWATESSPEDLRDYMFFYAGISGIAWVATNGTMWSTQIKAAIQSGAVLHAQLLERIIHAPLTYFIETDVGIILNRSITEQIWPGHLSYRYTTLSGISELEQSNLQALCTNNSHSECSTYNGGNSSVLFYLCLLYPVGLSSNISPIAVSGPRVKIALRGSITIRAFGWKGKFEIQNTKVLDLSQKPFYLLISLQSWLKMTLDCLIAIVAVTLILFTVLYKDTLTGADIGLALNLIIVANSTLLKLVESWTSLETSLGAVSRLKSVQECTPSERGVLATVNPGQQWPSSGKLQLHDLSVSYNRSSVPALENISLVITAGQKMIVIGRTGSGKSTLMLSLLQILTASQGSIWIDGIDLARVPLNTVRQRGFIAAPQDGFHIPTATLRFNLDPHSLCSEAFIIEALKKTQLWRRISSIALLNLNGKEDARQELRPVLDLPMSIFLPLSAGELQLFALCRTLLRVWINPSTKPIIVLDEASSSLDPQAESILEEILCDDLRNHTVIMVAHRFEGIMKAMRSGVDSIVTMQNGHLEDISIVAGSS